ncbi:helix-turn-helix domain-containing protein [Nocardia sp. NPDC059240]|uniref:helix-turn-helix domain-containing protein n=1 Tax=Nocardia sp. NPDC059240 TaxID=3346786 RepID=UPI00369F764C
MRHADLGRGVGDGWEVAGAGAAIRGGAMIGYRDVGGAGLDLKVAGAASVTVLVEFGDRGLTVEDAVGRRELGGFVAGLPLGAMRLQGAGVECIEVRLSPERAYSMLGVPPGSLGRGAVSLEELWGARAVRLRERLAEAGSWDERFELMKSFLAQSDRQRTSPDPEVLDGWRRILTSGGQVRIGQLVADTGWSYKRLGARFEAQIGLTPKRAAMLVRFRAAVDGLLAGRAAAEVAVDCGYVDQAHLCRDVGIFAELTPGSLTAEYLPAIARYRYSQWGNFFQYGAVPSGR